MRTRAPRVLHGLVRVLSVINLLLALNFFPVVPLLGWLSFGRAGWAMAWIPEAVLLLVLPAAYNIYWHYWFLVAGVAVGLSGYWWRHGGAQEARAWTVANGATMVIYVIVRIVLAAQGIRPDVA